MKAITITNEKGGVGKTTAAVHLAHRLVALNNKVVFVDADGQGNSTRFLKPYLSKTSALSFFTQKLKNIESPDLLIFHSSRKLFALRTIYLNIIEDNKTLLKNLGYDYIVFDTSANLSELIYAVFNLSDGAFIPINMSEFALDGVDSVMSTLNKVNKTSPIQLYGLIPNFVSGLSKKHKVSLGQLITAYPDKMMPYLSQRTPFTEVMNGITPIWNITPSQGNIKQASHQMIKVMDAMINTINDGEMAHV